MCQKGKIEGGGGSAFFDRRLRVEKIRSFYQRLREGLVTKKLSL